MSDIAAGVPGMVADAAEVARFSAERDHDATQERWLVVGQALMVLLVGMVVSLLVVLEQQ